MKQTRINVEKITIPTYLEHEYEEMPMFAENRVHQRSSGNVYPNKILNSVGRDRRVDKEYTAVHLENKFLDVWVLPEIGGRIFAAQDKTTGYDFFYRQHVIKPALIGVLGSWISGGVEFNWPFHHRPSGFMPCDFTTEEKQDGSVICWLSEHEPIDRMKGMVGIVLRPNCSYIETKVQLCNRTPHRHSFLWWENTAVPVNENYRIFFPKDVTYVNYHYNDSRISYPVAGGESFNGYDMRKERDISWHKNTRDATSYFACESKYDFFGGYDYGENCGVVHIANHHISPGKKLFTWGYKQLSKSWENALTDTDGQYAELMAGVYSNNQPDFSWIEPYETKEFSQYWYPLSQIGAPDFANLDVALRLGKDHVYLQSTSDLGVCDVVIKSQDQIYLNQTIKLTPGNPVKLPWTAPDEHVQIQVYSENEGRICAEYQEQKPDRMKKPPTKSPLPLASELISADTLYLAGVHVEQYRDPAITADAYWLEALKRNPDHTPSLIAMGEYCIKVLQFKEAEKYLKHAIDVLTRFNKQPESGKAHYLYALTLERQGYFEKAYDHYYKASWNQDCYVRSMVRIACLDLRKGNNTQAVYHARQALKQDLMNPLAPVVLMIAEPNNEEKIAKKLLALDPLHLFARYKINSEGFFASLKSEASQSVLDMIIDLGSMGQYKLALQLMESFVQKRPDQQTAMVFYMIAYYRYLSGMVFNNALDIAEKAPLGRTYPVRPEEADALKFAQQKGSKRAVFLLGCLLYGTKNYDKAAELFEKTIQINPNNYMGYRCLAIAYYSHLNKRSESLGLMKKALDLHPSQQVLYETVILMDKLSCDPEDKIYLLQNYELKRDDLLIELTKAFNQANREEDALNILTNHAFIPCEGGEHAVANQYSFALYQKGIKLMCKQKWPEAIKAFEDGITLPDSLGAGRWNQSINVPWHFRRAQCLIVMGEKEEAQSILRDIIDIEVEFFSNLHLPDLPYWQAMSASLLGMDMLGLKIMNEYKYKWSQEIIRKDSGYFDTTPFFISFIDDPEEMRRAYYLYLCALTDDFEQEHQKAFEKFKASYKINSDHLFAGLGARSLENNVYLRNVGFDNASDIIREP